VARKGKMLNQTNKYFDAQYIRWLKANAYTQDLTVLNEVLCIAMLLKQCIMGF